MKKLFISCLALFVSFGLQARVLSVNEAKLEISSIAPSVKLAYTAKTADKPDLYVFNKTGNKGFLVVAAEDGLDDIVLGFCDNGEFDYQRIPDNLKYWLGEYQKQITWARENGYKSHTGRKGALCKAQTIVSPLLGNISWDQDDPYNRMCPVENGTHCLTGCVATAMAQIMYFYQWPLHGTGYHTNRNDDSQTVVFANSVYDWANMLPSYKGTYTDEQANAVALLMRDCGCSVDMKYGVSFSGAFMNDVSNALISNFDYSADAEYINRESVDDWDAMLTAEMDAKRPVLYGAQDDNGSGGHAFVCDGYQILSDVLYFHFNFGWSGNGDGYFRTTAINTLNQKFNSSQGVVKGIHPNNKQKVNGLCYNVLSDGTASVTFSDDPSEYAGDITIPSSVVLDGKTYPVSQIGLYAFSDCASLKSVSIPASVTSIERNAFYGTSSLKTITVNWSDPILVKSSAFELETVANATLRVPAGSVQAYASLSPWMLFGTITDGSEKVEYGALQPFETGKGDYMFKTYFAGQSSDLDVVSRTVNADGNTVMVIVKDWKNELPLVILLNTTTNQCQVPLQFTGEIDYMYGPICISDIPTYAEGEESTYENYPCTYNPVTGTFVLNLIAPIPEFVDDEGVSNYWVGQGIDKLRMHGFMDFSIDISTTDIEEQADGTGIVTFSVTKGPDLKSYKYTLVNQLMSEEEVADLAQKIATGEVTENVKSPGLVQKHKLTLPENGTYTFVVVGFDANKEYQNYAFSVVDFVTDGVARLPENASRKEIFDLMGHKLSSPKKGINIINGKKFLMK